MGGGDVFTAAAAAGIKGTHIYVCKNCNTFLAHPEHIMSTTFKGRDGKAYLFEDVINVITGSIEIRVLITGKYVCSDICCNRCNQVLGWKYDKAVDQTQKYKEGKFVLEITKLTEAKCV